MFTRIILVIFLAFAIAGCTTSSKKQATKSQTMVSESHSPNYDVAWPSDNYGKPAKKTYSESAIELSQKQIQRALKKAGFYKGEIDGKMGPKTKEAIMRFQKAHGLKADGIVGKRTNEELRKYL